MRFLAMSMLLGGLISGGASAQSRAEGLETRNISVGDQSYQYQVYVPTKLRGVKNAPVILFLHGIGQRGHGGFLPRSGAAGTIALGYLDQAPAVVLLPQCSNGRYWHNADMDQMVMAELAATVEEFTADPDRVYLTGVSMGGYGAWHLASQHPQMFAALVSICGGSPLTMGDRFNPIASKVGTTPTWVFHGAEDRVVPVDESRQMVEALRKVKGNRVRYSEYKGVGHNVWMNALAEPELMPWLLEQRRGK
jgi:predicted peptidase